MKARILSTPRELVYIVLLAFIAFSLTLSYQLNSISIILLAVFYLCDKNLISKVKGLSFNVAYFYLIYFIIHVIGLLITENMQEGLKEVTVKLSFLLLPIIIFSEKISKDYLYQLFVLFKVIQNAVSYRTYYNVDVVDNVFLSIYIEVTLIILNIYVSLHSVIFILIQLKI